LTPGIALLSEKKLDTAFAAFISGASSAP